MKNSNLPHPYIPWPTVMKDILNVWWFVQCRIILFSIQRGHCVICWDSLPCKQFLIQLVLLSFHRFHHCTITISSFYWVLSNHYNAALHFFTNSEQNKVQKLFSSYFQFKILLYTKYWTFYTFEKNSKEIDNFVVLYCAILNTKEATKHICV